MNRIIVFRQCAAKSMASCWVASSKQLVTKPAGQCSSEQDHLIIEPGLTSERCASRLRAANEDDLNRASSVQMTAPLSAASLGPRVVDQIAGVDPVAPERRIG